MDMDGLLSFTQQVQTVRAYSMLVTLQGPRRTEKAEKTCLRKRQVITQRITNFKKCYKGKVQDALKTRNRENN